MNKIVCGFFFVHFPPPGKFSYTDNSLDIDAETAVVRECFNEVSVVFRSMTSERVFFWREKCQQYYSLHREALLNASVVGEENVRNVCTSAAILYALGRCIRKYYETKPIAVSPASSASARDMLFSDNVLRCSNEQMVCLKNAPIIEMSSSYRRRYIVYNCQIPVDNLPSEMQNFMNETNIRPTRVEFCEYYNDTELTERGARIILQTRNLSSVLIATQAIHTYPYIIASNFEEAKVCAAYTLFGAIFPDTKNIRHVEKTVCCICNFVCGNIARYMSYTNDEHQTKTMSTTTAATSTAAPATQNVEFSFISPQDIHEPLQELQFLIETINRGR